MAIGAILVGGIFVCEPFFETVGEEKKAVQAGVAMCMARIVECAVDIPVSVLQKLVPRICKELNSENFLAKAALLSVVANLSKVCLGLKKSTGCFYLVCRS